MTRPSTLRSSRTMVRLMATTLGILGGCGDDGTSTGSGGGGGAPVSSTATTATISTSTGGGGDAASCGPVTGWPPSEACTTCSWTHCCDEVAACSTSATCSGYASCIQPCGDDLACLDACATLNWGDTPQDLDLLACQVEHCPEECGLAERRCDLWFAAPNAVDRDACHGCVTSACCDENQAAFDPSVVAFLQCFVGCEDAACLRACEVAHPAALAPFDAASACILGTCGEWCAPDEPGALCGGFVIGDVECASCARPACCEAYEACAFDIGCRDFLACWQGCFDEASCRACFETWPAETVARAVAMEGCASVACADACSIRPCGVVKELVPAGCAACLEEGCCDATGACVADESCAALLVCTDPCGDDAACRAACADAHPAGADLHAFYTSCRDTSCSEDCP